MSGAFEVTNLLSKRPKVSSGETVGTRTSLLSAAVKFLKEAVIGNEVIRISDQEGREKRRRIARSVGIILLVLLLVSVGFGSRRRAEGLRDEELKRIEDQVRYAMEQASGLSAISPARARSVVLTARASVQQESTSTKDKYIRSRLAALDKELESALNTAGHVMSANPELYLDLGLVREGTTGSAMSLFGKKLFVLDRSSGVLLLLSTDDRSGEVVGGGDVLSKARAVAGSDKKGHVVTDHSVVEVIIDDKTSTPVVTDDDGVWKDPIGIAYFSGNMYIFDRAASEIYKYPSTESGFGSRRRWLAPGVTPDLSDAVSFAVDGDAWVLFRDGSIKRFRRGSQISFSESGADPFGDAASFSIPTGGSRTWILDRENGRVVAFDRESGEYAGQWESDLFKNATSLAVSEEFGKMFFLAGEKIYVVGIE